MAETVAGLERYLPHQAVVGQGSTSSVTVAQDAVSKTVVALKTVDKRKVSKDLILREICAQLSVSGHPNICTLFDAVEAENSYTIVQEFLPNGDLFDIIPADVGMREEEAMKYAREIVAALEYMHDRGVVHRDVKPDNICLAEDGSCRLIDFGHAAFLRECNWDRGNAIGTVPYMAFETFLPSDARPAEIDYRLTDMWAFGVTVFVMCTGMFPWHKPSVSDREFVAYMLGSCGPAHAAQWSRFSPALTRLLRGVMNIKVVERWTASFARAFIDKHWPSMGTQDKPMEFSYSMDGSYSGLITSPPPSHTRQQYFGGTYHDRSSPIFSMSPPPVSPKTRYSQSHTGLPSGKSFEADIAATSIANKSKSRHRSSVSEPLSHSDSMLVNMPTSCPRSPRFNPYDSPRPQPSAQCYSDSITSLSDAFPSMPSSASLSTSNSVGKDSIDGMYITPPDSQISLLRFQHETKMAS